MLSVGIVVVVLLALLVVVVFRRRRRRPVRGSSGFWTYDDGVYDFAVNHPDALVLRRDAPRVVLFKNVLNAEEIRHLIAKAEPKLVPSGVVGVESRSSARTSDGCWPDSDDTMRAIERRLHDLVGIPVEYGEALHVLRYKPGQLYLAHHDNCVQSPSDAIDEPCLDFLRRGNGPACGPSGGGPSCGDRIVTIIVYLHSPEEGGRTVFPRTAARRLPGGDPEGWYCEQPDVFGVMPNPGDAVVFYSYKPANDGLGSGNVQDKTATPGAEAVLESLHAGCPVTRGEKWIATRWIRSAPVQTT